MELLEADLRCLRSEIGVGKNEGGKKTQTHDE